MADPYRAIAWARLIMGPTVNALSNGVNAFSDVLAKLAYMRDFKASMKMARIRAGYASQQAAADAIGCERGTIGMWEAPSSPVEKLSGDYLLPAAIAYRVRPEWLSGSSEDDGYPWKPDGPSGASQVRRYDLEILATAMQNVGIQGVAEESALFDEYRRLAAMTAADLHANRSKPGGKSEPEQRGSGRTGKDSERKGRRTAK